MSHLNPEKAVREFHNAFGLTDEPKPTLPSMDTADGRKLRKLRIKLLREEFNEYLDAEDDDDIVEIADALADIVYIAYGTAVAYGIPLSAVFDEVHASNMSKLDANGQPIYREDGKVMKSDRYFRANIRGIIEAALNAESLLDR